MNKINKVSILGGAGFLGTRLSQRLYNKEQNHEICDLEVGEASKNPTIVDIEDLSSLNLIDNFSKSFFVLLDTSFPLANFDIYNTLIFTQLIFSY